MKSPLDNMREMRLKRKNKLVILEQALEQLEKQRDSGVLEHKIRFYVLDEAVNVRIAISTLIEVLDDNIVRVKHAQTAFDSKHTFVKNLQPEDQGKSELE